MRKLLKYFLIFRPKVTMQEVYEETRKKAERTRNQAKTTVYCHQYIQHMAEAKLKALSEWEATERKAKEATRTGYLPVTQAKDEQLMETS